jgi:hypothetical protein
LQKKNATSNCPKWLGDLAIARAEAGLESATNGIKVMRHREKVGKDNCVINKVMKPSQQKTLTRVETVSAAGVQTHVTKVDIENVGLAENQRIFQQSQSTPLQHPIALETFGCTGMKEATDKMLRTGIVPPEVAELDPFLEDYLATHKVGNVHLINTELTTASHQQGWQKARENTGTGVSPIHFGHFMAGSRQANIAAFETCMSGIPWTTGYSPKHWKQGLEVMIEKKPGLIDVKALRTILLFEPEYSQGNK